MTASLKTLEAAYHFELAAKAHSKTLRKIREQLEEELAQDLAAQIAMNIIDHNAKTLTQAHHVNAPIMESMLIREVQS